MKNFSIFHEVFKFFSCFQTLRKTFGFLAKFFWLGCQNCFQVSMGDLGRMVFSKRILWKGSFFWTVGTKTSDFQRYFSTGSSKLHSMCPEEIFDWSVFSTENFDFFHSPWAVRKKFWKIGAKALRGLSKLHFTCTKEIFWGNLDFEEKKFYTFFEYWSKTSRTFVKKCWVIEKLWERLSFSLEKFNVFLRNFREKFFGVR